MNDRRAPSPLSVYVSAASRGLGLEIASRFAADGASVAISSRDSSRLEAARKQIEARGATTVLALPGDLADGDAQQQILDGLETHRFDPDVIVCSAGQPPNVSLGELSRDRWQRDVEMLLGQAVFVAQRFAPRMAARGFGRFIFVSSSYAKAPTRGFVTSSIARAGLFALSKVLVDAYADRGVASFVLNLGFVDTPLLRNMAIGAEFDAASPAGSRGRPWEERYAEWAKLIPAGEIGTPEDLAEIVAFLTTPAAAYLNGAVLPFSGGLDRSIV